MSDPKPLATLTPTLLARKGGAKPAMRSQMGAIPSAAAVNYDDLGWNDLGGDHGHVMVAEPQIQAVAPEPDGGAVRFVQEVTEVLVGRQQRVRKRSPESRPRPFADAARRTAFTLRVDAERHLKLRLACALHSCSAQQLVTDALDRLLDDLPDVAVLAAQVTRTRN